MIFGLLGRFIGMLGGSLNQVLIPAVCTGYFLRHRQPAAAAVMLFWTGESLVDVAIYVADGRDMALPLLAEGLVHDWNWILSELSLRNHAPALGRVVFAAGVSVLAAAVALLAADALAHRRAAGLEPACYPRTDPPSTGRCGEYRSTQAGSIPGIFLPRSSTRWPSPSSWSTPPASSSTPTSPPSTCSAPIETSAGRSAITWRACSARTPDGAPLPPRPAPDLARARAASGGDRRRAAARDRRPRAHLPRQRGPVAGRGRRGRLRPRAGRGPGHHRGHAARARGRPPGRRGCRPSCTWSTRRSSSSTTPAGWCS